MPGPGRGQPLPSGENGRRGPSALTRPVPTGRSRGAIISQYYNRSVRLRRASRPQLQVLGRARPSLRLYDLELGAETLEDEGECLGAGASLGGEQVRLARARGWGQQTQGPLPQRAARRSPALRP